MEFGLCCKFYKEDIRYRTYTLKNIKSLGIENGRKKVLEVVANNIDALKRSFEYCSKNDIGAFRVSSDIVPHLFNLLDLEIIRKTEIEYIQKELRSIDKMGLLLSMHPGQYVNMGSPTKSVVENSVRGLKEHFFVAECLGIEEINIHIGGAYGDKEAAKKRFIVNMTELLSKDEMGIITIENDELNYGIEDVVEVAKKLGIRAVFDIHHERVYRMRRPSNKGLEALFLLARETWEEYGYQRVHLSSPKNSFASFRESRSHSDYIDIVDVPRWIFKYPDVYMDIEAKAKECAIKKLKYDLSSSGILF